MSTPHIGKNRRYWEKESDEYQRKHGETLTRTALAWGVWRIPEAELRVLGDVRRRDVLELGCGAAQWSIALEDLGARPVGLDVSRAQLDHARTDMEAAGASFPLVEGSAEELPFADETFDVVFCDHGAMSFTDPHRSVPEVARVLRPGGLFAFCHESPFHFVCWDHDSESEVSHLRDTYFEMRSAEDETAVVFQLPYGEWLALFRKWGLALEELIEPRPGLRARTTYEDWNLDWARNWPAENIWRLRKAGGRDVPRLVGMTEAAEILGWDRRRVATYASRGSFPGPVAHLAGGRVWAEEDVLEFARAYRARRGARQD